ncbi:MAG TPA: ribulose-phosphate 3-epimerase [Actinobacteria bacterium]|nr:ribulose-phosphate 3-epimerase [Actinomycetota bacterium]
MNKVYIAPSILSADFSALGKQISDVEAAGADVIHVDVMDGHFVPNITVGHDIVRSIKKTTKLPVDVHLMIEHPEFYIDHFVDAGADWISVHVEACAHLHRTLHLIKSKDGIKVGVAINPATALTNLVNVLEYVDFILLMSVNPGFGGQKFIEQSFGKIKFLKEMITKNKSKALIEVDGGVDSANASSIIKAGADILVAGSSVFSNGSIKNAITQLKKAAK